MMLTQQLFNTQTAAEHIGCSKATVSRWARRLEVGQRIGAYLVLTEDEVEKISEHIYPGPGNPQFSKQDPRKK